MSAWPFRRGVRLGCPRGGRLGGGRSGGGLDAGRGPSAEVGRSPGEDRADRLVELPDAREAGTQGDLCDREVGRLEENAGSLGALGPGEREGAGPDLGHQDAVELTLGVAEPAGETGDPVAVDCAVEDQADRPGGDVRPTEPFGRSGRGVRPAPQARPEPGLLGGGGREVEADVLGLGSLRRAARPAVDAGRRDGGEEPPVEAGVPATDRPVTVVEIGEHAVIVA